MNTASWHFDFQHYLIIPPRINLVSISLLWGNISTWHQLPFHLPWRMHNRGTTKNKLNKTSKAGKLQVNEHSPQDLLWGQEFKNQHQSYKQTRLVKGNKNQSGNHFNVTLWRLEDEIIGIKLGSVIKSRLQCVSLNQMRCKPLMLHYKCP